jgi:hypothetical protein
VANLFYRNTNAKISFEVLDVNNALVGLSSTSTVFYYIKSPDNYIYSNDPNIITNTYANGIGSYITNPVYVERAGIYYINYVLNKIGEYKYKFQVNDNVVGVNLAVSGDIKVVTDGIF